MSVKSPTKQTNNDNNDPPSSPPTPRRPTTPATITTPPLQRTIDHSRRVTIQEPNGDKNNDQYHLLSSPPDKSSKPSRSILKQGINSSPIKPKNNREPLPQVAMTSPSARLAEDAMSGHINVPAYQHEELFNGCVKALQKNEYPDRNAEYYNSINSIIKSLQPIKRRGYSTVANALCKCAKRDLISVKGIGGTSQYQLVTIVTKVVTHILANRFLVVEVEPDLARWFITHSLDILEDEISSKGFVATHLNLINFQRIENPLTTESWHRLMAVLNKGSRFKSASLIAEFILGYKLLLKGNPTLFVQQSCKWIKSVMDALLDPNRLISNSALKVLLELKLFNHNEVSKQLIQWCNVYDEVNDITNFERLFRHMNDRVMKDRQQDKIGCELWAVFFMLFVNYGNSPIEGLESTRTDHWLEIAKNAIIKGDGQTRNKMLLNWSIVVYSLSARPLNSYGDKNNILDKAINAVLLPYNLMRAELKKKLDQGELLDEYTQSVFDNVLVSTLHAFLRPTMPNDMVTIIWDRLLYNTLEFHQRFGLNLSKFFTRLLDTKPPNKVSSRSELLKNHAERDCIVYPLGGKWVRTHAAQVLSVLQKGYVFQNQSNKSGWEIFCSTIRNVTSREVRISNETIECVTLICRFLQSCWDYTEESEKFSSFAHLVMTLVNSLDFALLMNKQIGKTTAIGMIWTTMSKLPEKMERQQEAVRIHEKLVKDFMGFVESHRDMNQRKFVKFLCTSSISTPDHEMWYVVCTKLLASLKRNKNVDADDILHPLRRLLEFEKLGNSSTVERENCEIWRNLIWMGCTTDDQMFEPKCVLKKLVEYMESKFDKTNELQFNYIMKLVDVYVGLEFSDDELKNRLFGLLIKGNNEMLKDNEDIDSNLLMNVPYVTLGQLIQGDGDKSYTSNILDIARSFLTTKNISIVTELLQSWVYSYRDKYCRVEHADYNDHTLAQYFSSASRLNNNGRPNTDFYIITIDFLGWLLKCDCQREQHELSLYLVKNGILPLIKGALDNNNGSKGGLPESFITIQHNIEKYGNRVVKIVGKDRNWVTVPSGKELEVQNVYTAGVGSQDDTQLVETVKKKNVDLQVQEQEQELVEIEQEDEEICDKFEVSESEDEQESQSIEGQSTPELSFEGDEEESLEKVENSLEQSQAASESPQSDPAAPLQPISRSVSMPIQFPSQSQSQSDNEDNDDSRYIEPIRPRPIHQHKRLLSWFTDSKVSKDEKQRPSSSTSLKRHPNATAIASQVSQDLESNTSVSSPRRAISFASGLFKYATSFLGSPMQTPSKEDKKDGKDEPNEHVQDEQDAQVEDSIDDSKSDTNKKRKRDESDGDDNDNEDTQDETENSISINEINAFLSRIEQKAPFMSSSQRYEIETRLLEAQWKLRKQD